MGDQHVDPNRLTIRHKLEAYLPAHLSELLKPDIKPAAAHKISNHITSLRGVLSTYLPRYLVELIDADPSQGGVSGSFRQGAVIFADVSGFTAMSERLSTLGKEGAEEMTGIVNDYFAAMLEISDRCGGDLLKFGGDALLIFFEGPEGPQLAVSASATMQTAMHQFAVVDTSQGTFPLRMSIGVASGSIFLASLGSPERMNYSVLGPTLTSMALAENQANAGEVIVDPATCAATRQIAQYHSAADGFWRLEKVTAVVIPEIKRPKLKEQSAPDKQDEGWRVIEGLAPHLNVIETLGSYVPEELFSQLVFEPQSAVTRGSHRPVTTLFVNFYGLDEIIATLGAERQECIVDLLNMHVVTMSEVITHFGGTISRLDPYIVGHRIMALFGAPQAHENDPLRAVRTAIEMNRRLDGINHQTDELLRAYPDCGDQLGKQILKQRIGVNTGFVFSGNVGSQNRREYTVMGDQVNLTARLMSVAEQGEVLIGHSTARHAEREFLLTEKQAVKVKGIQDPVRNYLVSGVLERTHGITQLSSNPIVGREAELLQGQQAVDQAMTGDGRVLVIQGVSGIGKTRLAEEISLYGHSKGMGLLAGSCLSYGSTMVYHPWTEVLRDLFGIQLTDPHQSAQIRLESLQQGMNAIHEEAWMPVIGTVLGLDIPDNDLTRDLDAKLRRQRVLDLVVKLLQARAQHQPLMVVLEDAHWADPASMDLIDYVARNLHNQPILLLINHRPDEGLPDWCSYPHAERLPLSDLTDQACLEVLQNITGVEQFPASLEQLILDKASGNPFYLSEVVRALIDTGILTQTPSGDWQVVQALAEVELPDTIHGLIISRIDRLIASDRAILQVASVVGRLFAFQTLHGVYEHSEIEDVIQERLNYLNQLGLTETHNLEQEIYRFVHLTTRDVVYESMSFEHRRELHRRIGSFVEQTFADSLSEQVGLLAYHYYEGKAWDKALQYNLTAAQHAQREYANDTAIAACERSMEAAINLSTSVDTTEERLTIYETLCEVLTLIGRYEEALQHLSAARNMFDVDSPTQEQKRRLAEFYRKTADVYERRSEYQVALEWLDRGLSYLDETIPSIEIMRNYILQAGINYRQGSYENAINHCQKSMDASQKIDTREANQSLAQTYYLMGELYRRLGDLIRAAEFCQESVEIYKGVDDIVGQAKANNNLAIVYDDLGDWDKASQAYHNSLEINQRIGNIQEQGFIANNLAIIQMNRGIWDEAIELFQQSNQIWKEVGAALPDAVTLSNLAQVHIYQGNLAEAELSLKTSHELFDEIGSDAFMPELERRWGEYYIQTGDLDRALIHTNRSIDLASKQEDLQELGMSLRVLGEVHMDQGDYDAAEIALNKSVRILQDMKSEYEASKSMLSLIALSLKIGLPVNRKNLEETTHIFKDLGAQVDHARAKALSKQLSDSGNS